MNAESAYLDDTKKQKEYNMTSNYLFRTPIWRSLCQWLFLIFILTIIFGVFYLIFRYQRPDINYLISSPTIYPTVTPTFGTDLDF